VESALTCHAKGTVKLAKAALDHPKNKYKPPIKQKTLPSCLDVQDVQRAFTASGQRKFPANHQPQANGTERLG
jgi:hypothetical protein